MMNIKEHLISRRMNIEFFNPFLDYENDIAYLRLYNFSRIHNGMLRYDPFGSKKLSGQGAKSKYYTFIGSGQFGIFGIETLEFNSDKIALVEGIFDAVRLANYGVTVFATLGATPPNDFKNQLSFLRKHIVVIPDPDNAGKRLTRFGNSVIELNTDLGDATEETVAELAKHFR